MIEWYFLEYFQVIYVHQKFNGTFIKVIFHLSHYSLIFPLTLRKTDKNVEKQFTCFPLILSNLVFEGLNIVSRTTN